MLRFLRGVPSQAWGRVLRDLAGRDADRMTTSAGLLKKAERQNNDV